jgi:hypothetical protein
MTDYIVNPTNDDSVAGNDDDDGSCSGDSGDDDDDDDDDDTPRRAFVRSLAPSPETHLGRGTTTNPSLTNPPSVAVRQSSFMSSNWAMPGRV